MNAPLIPDHRHRLPLAAGVALVLGAALRLPGMWTDMQLDEVWSLDNAANAHSWFSLLRLKIDNNHHLTSLYMHALGPDSASAVYRLPAYISGVAAVALAWLIGSRDSRTTGIVTSLMFATSAAFVFYSSEARGYATAVCLMLVGWYCLQRYAEAPAARWLLGFAVSSIAGVMSHQTFVLFYVGAFIWCDAHMQKRHRLRSATRLTMRVFALPTIGIGLFAAVALIGQEIGGGPPFDVPVIIAQTLALTVGGPQDGPGLWVVAAFSAGIVVAAIWSAYRLGDDRWFFFVAAGVIAPVLIVILRRPPTLAPRYFLVPAAVLLLAVGRFLARRIEEGGTPRAVASAMIAAHVVAGVWFTFSPSASRGGYRAALTHIASQSGTATTLASANTFSGSDWRTELMVRYYARAIGARERLRYVPASQAAGEAVEWVIDESPGGTPLPEWEAAKRTRDYTIEGTYPSGPISGINWRVYRPRPSGVDRR